MMFFFGFPRFFGFPCWVSSLDLRGLGLGGLCLRADLRGAEGVGDGFW